MQLLQLSFVFFLLLALGCCAIKAQVDLDVELEVLDRILRGLRADIAEYPYQVGLQTTRRKNGKLYDGRCGGSIISEYFILTAAHCVLQPDVTFDAPVTADDLVVFANHSILGQANQGGQLAYVKTIFIHPYADIAPRPEGQRHCMDNDVAILELANPLTLGPGIEAIPLPEPNTEVPVNARAEISGYGINSYGLKEHGNQLGQLYATKVRIADCRGCYASQPPETVICAGKIQHAPGILIGDSGGPLVVDGVLEGVAACLILVKDCPDAFMKVADYYTRAFIESVTGI